VTLGEKGKGGEQDKEGKKEVRENRKMRGDKTETKKSDRDHPADRLPKRPSMPPLQRENLKVAHGEGKDRATGRMTRNKNEARLDRRDSSVRKEAAHCVRGRGTLGR